MPAKIKILNLLALVVVLSVLFIIAGPFTLQIYSAQESPCLACHADFKKPAKSVHAAMGMGCETCHKPVEGKSHPDQKGSIKLTQDVPELCYNCHDRSKFTTGKSGHTVVGMCTGCHNPHASNSDKLLKAGQPELCYFCHEKTKFAKKYVHSIITAGGCTSCHTPHISNNPALLSSNDINELCKTCHSGKDGRHIVSLPGKRIHPITGKDPSTLTMIKVPDPARPGKEMEVPDPKNPGKDITCTTCHDPHSSDFANLFPQKNMCGKCHKYY